MSLTKFIYGFMRRQKLRRKFRTKKLPFLLLEVLIGISLLIVFAPLLMRLPIHHYKSQIRHFEELEKQRISDWTYSEIKETLLKGAIAWKMLPERSKDSKNFPLSNTSLYLPGLKSKTLKRSFALKCKSEKEGKQGEIFRLYELVIYVGDSPFKYMLVIQLV